MLKIVHQTTLNRNSCNFFYIICFLFHSYALNAKMYYLIRRPSDCHNFFYMFNYFIRVLKDFAVQRKKNCDKNFFVEP